MRAVLGAVLIAAVACGACEAGATSSPATLEKTASSPSSGGSITDAAAIASAGSPSVAPEPSAKWWEPMDCPVATERHLEAVVALAMEGLADTTGGDGWSRACAWLQPLDNAQAPYTVTLEVGWAGTLHDYGSIPGAIRIVGLADDAVAFDAGRQIAVRSGELVVVVADSRSDGGSPTFTEASAREVAELINSLET